MNAVTLPAKNYNMLILFRRSVPLKRFASVSAWAFYCKTALQAVLCLFQQNYLKSCPAVWNAVYVDLPEK